MTTKRALLVVGAFMFLIMITLIAPATWVGVKPGKHTSLILRDSNDLAVLSKDTDRNSNPDWRDLLFQTTSASTSAKAGTYVVTEADKKRLDDPNNITSSFSKNLYTVSSYAKKAGDMSLVEQESIISNLVTKEASKIEVKWYDLDSLKIAVDETPTSIKTYGNQLGTVFKKAKGYKLDIADVDILKAYSVNKNPDVLSSLQIKKNNVILVVDELLKMSVPKSASPYHLLVINRLSEYKSVLEGLSDTGNDPMRGALAFNTYTPVLNALSSSLVNVQLYFKLQDVVFSSNEPGYVLTMTPTK